MKNTFLKTIGTAALAILMLAAFAQISVFAHPESGSWAPPGIFAINYPNEILAEGEGCETVECRNEVATARRATAGYHEISKALADGFVAASPCVRNSTLGTMGFHFANRARIDQTVDPAVPEVLLYLPDDEGEMRLVAVEYVVPNIGNPVPSLFGQPFHYSAARNRYELHAWIWRNNPSGMFADFNPKLNCPGF